MADALSHVDGGRVALRPRASLVAVALVAVAAAAWVGVHLRNAGTESTDDAEVDGHIVNVSPRVAGRIHRVLVRDNELVEPDQVLVELETEGLDVRVKAADAELAAARAALSSARSQRSLTEKIVQASTQEARAQVSGAVSTIDRSQALLSQARAELGAAAVREQLAQQELTRSRSLVRSGAIATAKLDTDQADFDAAEAAEDRARALLVGAESTISSSASGMTVARAHLAQAQAGPNQVASADAAVSAAESRVAYAQASLDLAKLDRTYAEVRAPLRGVVSRRTAEPGTMVGPDRPVLAVVGTDEVWIVANFKEDQTAHIQPGMPARIAIDAYDGLPLSGHVESLGGASGARFSILPPDNASGNFVKVVQRIPVIVRIDDRRDATLRPGMSVSVSVDTRHK
jgi:membrane fusion protein, multidrug efflux system